MEQFMQDERMRAHCQGYYRDTVKFLVAAYLRNRMVSRTEAILNLFETKAKREVWLDRYAASNMPIDLFCEMNHIKKETITKALEEKMSSRTSWKKIL